MDKKKLLINFIERAECFDSIAKLKLILFILGVKPNTFVALKVSPKNLHDKHHFDKHLKENRVVYSVSRQKSFEEISGIKGNKIRWRMKGTWYGYDLFKNEKWKKRFKEYVQLLKRQEHKKADFLAGKIYGYPSCCITNYIKEHNLKYLRKKHSYYAYYKKLAEMDRKFPFLNHTSCSVSCSSSRRLNKKYSETVKRHTPKFWRDYTKKKAFRTDVIFSDMSDVYEDRFETSSIWPSKDGYEYVLIAKKSYNGHYYMYSYLTKRFYEKGTVASARIAMQYNYADIKIGKVKGILKNLHHERKFLGKDEAGI